MIKVRILSYSCGELIEKNIFISASEISEIVDGNTRLPQLNYIGDGGNEQIKAVVIMKNKNAYRVIDNIDDILKALEV